MNGEVKVWKRVGNVIGWGGRLKYAVLEGPSKDMSNAPVRTIAESMGG